VIRLAPWEYLVYVSAAFTAGLLIGWLVWA
jgi:hypothetical protein